MLKVRVGFQEINNTEYKDEVSHTHTLSFLLLFRHMQNSLS